MAQLDLHIYIGDEQITGGTAVGTQSSFPDVAYPAVLGSRSFGHGLRMEELHRIEPSDATGATGGTYDPYWDGTTFAHTSTGTPTTTTIAQTGTTWGTNEFAGRLVTITSGAQNGLQRRIASNTGTTLTFAALPGAPTVGDTFRIEGGFVKFYHAPTTSTSGIPLVADQTLAKGDNWFSSIKCVTPMAMLMRRLAAQYGYTGNGFRVIKDAITASTSTWAYGSSGGDHLDTQIAAAIDVESAAGNTLKVKSIVLDAVTRDLFAANLFFESDLQRTIDSLRDRMQVRGIADAATTATATASTTSSLTVASATWTTDQWKGRTVRIDAGAMAGQLRLVASNTSTVLTFYDNTSTGQNYGPLASAPGNVAFSILASPLIVLAMPAIGIATSVSVVLAPAARQKIQAAVDRNTGVRTFDWQNVGTLATADEIGGGLYVGAVASDRFYDVPSQLAAGAAIHNAISAFYTALPSTAPGAAIACVFINGTSQMVTSSLAASAIALSGQRSLQGEDPSTVTPLVWIWNNSTETVQPLDVLTNASTFGSVLPGWAGPETTMGRALVRDEFTTGVVVFKYAKAGVALTSDAGSALAAGYVEPGGGAWDSIEVQFAKFKAAVMRDLNRSVDVIAIVNDLSENDLTQVAAFQTKAPLHIDRQRALCQTRVNDDVIPVFWMQPPPPAVDVTGGSSLGDPEARRTVRTWIKDTLPTLRDNVHVLQNDGPRRYELQRTDSIHYALEATLNIGEDFAELILEAFNTVEGETNEGSSETAALTVEDGSGLTSANSYCSVAFATTFHEQYGNPAGWTGATEAAQENALREATRALDALYGVRWCGERGTSEQALDWPRRYVVDRAGNLIDSDEIPTALQRATAAMALQHLAGESLLPQVQTNQDIRSETLASASGASHAVVYAGIKSASARFPLVERMLVGAGLIEGAGGWGHSTA
jgi:hypothetical protein